MDTKQWISQRRGAPAITRVPICADGQAVADLEAAKRNPNQTAAIPDLQAAVEAATIIITLQVMDSDEYRTLKDQHRPADVKSGQEYGDTFHLALVQHSLTEPDDIAGDHESIGELWKLLSLAEQANLFLAARDLNETIPDLGFIKPGTATTPGTGQSSTTASPAA